MSAIRLESTQGPVAGVRRSGRISKEIAIVLFGDNTEGRHFCETTKTLMLSQHGASVLCRHKLIPDQEMFLRAVAANREVEVRICGKIGEREDGQIYGVAFVDPLVDFWGIEFPCAEKLEKDLASLMLECTGCRQRVAVQFDAIEMDVYMVNEGVLRFCKRCLTSTFWKVAGEEATPALRPLRRNPRLGRMRRRTRSCRYCLCQTHRPSLRRTGVGSAGRR